MTPCSPFEKAYREGYNTPSYTMSPFKNPEARHQYYLKHRDTILAKAKEWQKTHKERVKQKRREYYKSHPEYVRRKKERTRQRFKQRREQILQNLGGNCLICGKQRGLELHHKVYGLEGNPYKEKSRFSAWKAILKEAEIHPERFVLLCHGCHKAVTVFESHPERLRKLLELIGLPPLVD